MKKKKTQFGEETAKIRGLGLDELVGVDSRSQPRKKESKGFTSTTSATEGDGEREGDPI